MKVYYRLIVDIMKVEIIDTFDGSHTLFVPELNEHYHSIYGAITESKHVFIENGFYKIKKREINIIEMGFGTGLNALLTLIEAIKSKINVYYYSIDSNPLNTEIINKLNYINRINGGEELKSIYKKFHECKWNEDCKINEYFILHKKFMDIISENPEGEFDLVDYDAFAPSKQPELWTDLVLKKFYMIMRHGGILTTYCASGSVKRTLRNIGFEVIVLPGPPGKREMINAIKK